MRIISGQYKGRKLQAGQDLSIRPTTDRVKEFIFNVLQDFQQDKVIADIFSGSGNLGFEALSRGAKHVTFVEKNISSVNVLKKNIFTFSLDHSQYSIVHKTAEDFAKENHSEIELYFLDPPFIYPKLQDLIDSITNSANFLIGNLMVLEHEVSNPIEKESEYYTILKQKKMSRSLISFIEKRTQK
ncbi:MAG: 16S rRNA (guanine(966)-N(2))-methyltransferase RsmD [Calditrichaeota bacterium]|nr:MAG: 16S rRNA (guanine(966)-N(2))-methyltransferase RsmD [Calditrichota bacterium]MBL1205439.1 16S rRNA (guanine(966)-N(2))-methyltransferase RsmD [Calditrichota bacterium]NOG45268.1 16S rRNA (guanine(966)-N(2))-methyltransferase RsmD [Calditrichota bacterium]